jgi:hypothetical protein
MRIEILDTLQHPFVDGVPAYWASSGFGYVGELYKVEDTGETEDLPCQSERNHGRNHIHDHIWSFWLRPAWTGKWDTFDLASPLRSAFAFQQLLRPWHPAPLLQEHAPHLLCVVPTSDRMRRNLAQPRKPRRWERGFEECAANAMNYDESAYYPETWMIKLTCLDPQSVHHSSRPR